MAWIFLTTIFVGCLLCTYAQNIDNGDCEKFANRLSILESITLYQIEKVRQDLDRVSKHLVDISGKMHCENGTYESTISQLSVAFRNFMLGVSLEKKRNRIIMDELYSKQVTLALLVDDLEKRIDSGFKLMLDKYGEIRISNRETLKAIKKISAETGKQTMSMVQTILTSVCPYGWIQYKQSCFYKYSVILPWDNAYRACAEVDAILPEVPDWGTNVFLSSLKGEFHQIWLGATDEGNEGTFVWNASATPLSFTSWGEGQPNNLDGIQHCLVLGFKNSNLNWNDIGCESRKEFVCQFKLKDAL